MTDLFRVFCGELAFGELLNHFRKGGNGVRAVLKQCAHGRTDYNEVGAMKQYAMDFGIASADIFMDHAGFSTYESMYRAKHIFEADKIIIVTQKCHLHRALHIAQSLGIEAYGVAADYHAYTGQTARDVREILARVKDFGTSIFHPKPTFLGNVIPITGDGNLTND